MIPANVATKVDIEIASTIRTMFPAIGFNCGSAMDTITRQQVERKMGR